MLVDVRNNKLALPTVYQEKLTAPLWWYPAGVFVSVLLGAEFATAVSGWLTWVPMLLLVPASVAVVWRWSSCRVLVTGAVQGETHSAEPRLPAAQLPEAGLPEARLIVPSADLRLSDVDRAIELSANDLRRLVGRHADPSAFLCIRSWIGPGVQLVLTEQAAEVSAHGAGPATPYWVVSSRHPAALLAALGKAG